MFSLKKISIIEIILSIVLVFYLIMDMETPEYGRKFLASRLGLLVMFLILVFLLIYSNPLVTILYVFAVYEFVRKTTQEEFQDEEEDEDEDEDEDEEEGDELKDGEEEELLEENFETEESLEKDIVKKMAPVGVGSKTNYKATSYKPVEGKLDGTSLF